MGFESVKKERSAKAWNFFNFDKSTEEAKCLLCQKIMKAKGSTTKSLNDHMKVKHSKEWAKDETNKKDTKSIEKSQPKIESFINKDNKKTPEEVISRLALDNISFSTIAKSQMMHEYFSKAGIDLPRSMHSSYSMA